MILDKINGLKDIKQLNREELHILADMDARHYDDVSGYSEPSESANNLKTATT